MGGVSSKPGEAESLYLRDQNRFSVASVNVTNSRNRLLLSITPNAFPATRYNVKKDIGNDGLIEYIQDPESVSGKTPPTFLLRLNNDEELNLNFTFIVRQTPASPVIYGGAAPPTTIPANILDTVINGLTFVFASNGRDLDNLVTREFHADPNLHKNPNVCLVGDYSTAGSASVQFQWSWKWRAPKPLEDKGGGWRTCCSFVEYDPRAHRLDTLANFSFWVQNTQRALASPKIPSPALELAVPPRLRVPSAQSIESRVSDIDGADNLRDPPQSPLLLETTPEYGLTLVPTTTSTATTVAPQTAGSITATNSSTAVKLDVACQRPGDDISQVEDGPLFRAAMKSLEQKTGNIRARWKKLLKRAESALEAQVNCNNAVSDLMEALREVSGSNANAVQPAIDHYFDKIAKEILSYERLNSVNIQKLIIDPIYKLYNMDIKQAEAKKKDFEEESKEFYSYLGRYLGQRQDSVTEKKKAETDTKYQTKRRNFELKRFDYSSFIQDLHGGRKDQEILSHLTRYANAQAKGFLEASKRIEAMIPQLEALASEVKEADKEFQLQRTEREEKRRTLEKSSAPYREPDMPQQQPPATPSNVPVIRPNGNGDPESSTRGSNPSLVFKSALVPPPSASPPPKTPLPVSSPGQAPIEVPAQVALPAGSPNPNKFRGIRDLEDKDHAALAVADPSQPQNRREGLLFAMSRPGSHVDPKGLNRNAWHKFWVVLDQGKLSEYNNWKNKLDLHMDPIDLRTAAVREARNAERRFCFEVITPSFQRTYQATSEEEMKTWISAINSALESAMVGKGTVEPVAEALPGSTRREIASVLTGKTPSLSSNRSSYTGNTSSKTPIRHATVGDRPSARAAESNEDPAKLLQQFRDADPGNKYCADCGTENKVEWASINLGISLCIDCGGIHRSLGTHISKVRSLTLDITSFTLDVVEILLTIGNRVSNMVWEAKLDRSQKPGPNSNRDQRSRFINAKYAERAFVQSISPTLSHYATADETLLASIKKNDIQNVLYALALRANPNATDRSRSTHAVFLALAAADPASPGSPAVSPISNGPGLLDRKPFTVAELLLQNGAELPILPAPIPLTPAAKLYLEQKAEQRAGRRIGPSASTAGGDTISALPHFSGNSSSADRAREREAKLQKRVSAGGRLIKRDGETLGGRGS